ncbi:MAG TPA: hypothetical protein PLC74_07860 [Acetobacteraceae bacterium]|nr:hypothetical protein [Acetobacteraceae bacterium]
MSIFAFDPFSADILAGLATSRERLAAENPQKSATLARLAALAASHAESAKTIVIPCSTCGAPSRPFIAAINADLWQCDACLPSDPVDQAVQITERVAIIAESTGNASAPVAHHMPVSWADATLVPTAGARCRNCFGRHWWTERDQPRGWRCSTCHPGVHLQADRRRDVTT